MGSHGFKSETRLRACYAAAVSPVNGWMRLTLGRRVLESRRLQQAGAMAGTNTVTELALVPAGTVVEADGEGGAFEVPAEGPRVFVVQVDIAETIEQESLELSIWGSADGTSWGAMPLVKFPQRFYRGSTRMALDLRQRPEVRFLRARWELNRWGRGQPVPHFRFGVSARAA
jgi:hypothetical protein